MAFEAIALQDCMTIQRTFERAAAHAVTEQSVFAMMAPILTPMRTQSKTFINQTETAESIENSSSAGVNAMGVGLANSDENNPSLFEKFIKDPAKKIGNNLFNDKENDIGKIFNTECIPCGFRLNTLGEITVEWAAGFKDAMSAYFEYWKSTFQAMIQQIISLINMFFSADGYIDLCALLKWLMEFVCIPDLARILSALMALMMKISLDFGGILDMILMFIAPLFIPLLSGIVDQLEKYLLMVIAPLECIIDSILDILRKLDYNILFDNIAQLDKSFSFGPKVGPRDVEDPRGSIGVNDAPLGPALGIDTKIPLAWMEVPRFDITESDERKWQGTFNTIPGDDAIKAKKAQDQKAVDKAASELAKLEASASQVDGANEAEVERYKAQKKAAKDKYDDAVEERDLSEIGQARKAISETTAAIKSSLLLLIGQLRDAAKSVEDFVKKVIDEFKKLLGIYIGGSGSMIELLASKQALVQMIGFITAVIKALVNGIDCSDDEGNIRTELFVPPESDFVAYTDQEGNFHLEQDKKKFDIAMTQAAQALGIAKGKTVEDFRQDDKGNPQTSEESRQKLKSLIEFTGDPILDTKIARATDALTIPAKVKFKCPLQTSVDDADQVNKWIRELEA